MREPVQCKVCGKIGQPRKIKAGNLKTEIALWVGPLILLGIAVVAFVVIVMTMKELKHENFTSVNILMMSPVAMWPCAFIYSAYRRIRGHVGCRSCGSQYIEDTTPQAAFIPVSQ